MTDRPSGALSPDTAQRHAALLGALQATATAPTFAESAPALLQALGVGLDWAVACLLVLDPAEGRLRLVDLWSPDPEHASFVEASRRLSFGPGEGLPGRAWLQVRSIWLEDLSKASWYLRRDVARAVGLESGVAVPLRAQGSVVGVLELYAAERRAPDTDLMAHLEVFGSVLGMGLQRSRDAALLREREERIRATIDSALDAVVSVDDAGMVTEWNRRAEVLFGWQPDEAIGRPLGELIVPERLRDSHRAGMQRYLATGQPQVIGRRIELPAIDRTGREFPVELTVSAHHTGGRPSFSAFLRDLSEQKSAEERMAILARLPEENPHPVIRVGADGTLLYTNRSGRGLVRQAPGRRVGRWLRDAVVQALERSVEVEIDHASRGNVYTVRVVPIPGRGYANVYALDITLRVQAEEALRTNEAALRDLYLVTSAPGLSSRDKLAELLRLARVRFGVETAALSRLAGEGFILEAADTVDARVRPGIMLRSCEAFGRRVVESGDVVAVADAAQDPAFSGGSPGAAAGLRSYIGAAVVVGGALHGVLSCFSTEPRLRPFHRVDIDYLRLVALWTGAEIEREGAREALAAANVELADAAAQATALAAEAEAADRAKGDFLATMSHEIRTPLSGILGMIELLKGTRIAVEEQHYLEVMESSGEALLSIINEILDFSKIESGELDIRTDQFDPSGLVAAVAALHRPTARAKGLAVRTIVEPGVPEHAIGDAVRISQAIGNLVSNAIKFTDTGSVTIRLSSPRDRWLEIAVIDTGIGIALHERDRLFKPFVQLDSSQARRWGGSGLGLAITQRLIQGMGGTINLQSEPGEGSEFTVRLPIAIPASVADDDRRGARPVTPVTTRRRRRRVLVVDDNPVNLQVATTLLERMGHRTVAAQDGEEGLHLIQNERFDLVLLDCQLPGLDGFEVTRRVRELETAHERQRLPIVAVTANAYEEGRQRAFAAGMDDYLTKPYRRRDLEAAVDRLLGSAAASRAPEPGVAATTEPELEVVAHGSASESQSPWRGEVGSRVATSAPGVLGELAVVAGQAMVREVVELFIATSVEAERRLRAAAAADDRAGVGREAHSLRGSSATVGANQLASACAELERAATTGHGALDGQLEAVLSTLLASRTDLQRWLAVEPSPVGDAAT